MKVPWKDIGHCQPQLSTLLLQLLTFHPHCCSSVKVTRRRVRPSSPLYCQFCRNPALFSGWTCPRLTHHLSYLKSLIPSATVHMNNTKFAINPEWQVFFVVFIRWQTQGSERGIYAHYILSPWIFKNIMCTLFISLMVKLGKEKMKVFLPWSWGTKWSCC